MIATVITIGGLALAGVALLVLLVGLADYCIQQALDGFAWVRSEWTGQSGLHFTLFEPDPNALFLADDLDEMDIRFRSILNGPF